MTLDPGSDVTLLVICKAFSPGVYVLLDFIFAGLKSVLCVSRDDRWSSGRGVRCLHTAVLIVLSPTLSATTEFRACKSKKVEVVDVRCQAVPYFCRETKKTRKEDDN